MFTKRSCLFNGLLVLGFLSCGLWGCSSSSDGDADTGGTSGSSSSTSSGGSGGTSSEVGGSSGGSSSSSKSVSSGGSSSSSSSSEVGGNSGGKTTEDSSSSSAGKGGSSQGGKATGGKGGSSKTGGATGGAATGGKATGGKDTGGAASGGATTGGAATGGSEKGGTTGSGGAATGGSATGGSSTGGGTGTSAGNGSPGCGSANALKSGSFTEKINNQDRQWILDVPSGYDHSKPTRLIFVWHPLMGNANQVASGGYNGLKSLSNNTTIFVAPNGVDGRNNEAQGNGWWNKDDADVKFLEAMLKKLNEGLCIDQERIFTTGFSFGGMMSYTMPFVFNVFRATAPCSGKSGVIPYTAKVNDAIPIMAFHGTNDQVCALSLAKDFFQKFLTRNGCGTETKQVSPSPCVEYQGCKVPTIWCQFSGQHEQWREEPAAIWKFFSQF